MKKSIIDTEKVLRKALDKQFENFNEKIQILD